MKVLQVVDGVAPEVLVLERNAAVGLPSDAQIDAGLDRLKDVLKRRGLADTIDATTIVNLAKLIEAETPKLPEKVVEQLLLGCVEAALDELVAMRAQEGAALKLDLGARCQSILDTILKIKVMAPGMVAKYRENLYGRLAQSGLEIDLDDERVLKEIALYSDRCDISEEMTAREIAEAQRRAREWLAEGRRRAA